VRPVRLLSLIILSFLTAPGLAQEISNEACMACHGTKGFSSPTGGPLFVDAQAFSAGVHGSLSCISCHSDVTKIPHAERLQPVDLDNCVSCHADAVGGYRESVHGRANRHGVREAASCSDCHGDIHTVIPHTERASPAHWSNLAATCARCHAKIEIEQKFRIPVVRPVEAYRESVHARAIVAGQPGAVCSDCHGSHAILPASDPRSPIWRTNIPETCGKCHSEVLKAYRESVHGRAVASGVRQAPVCTDCHGEHRILGPSEPTSPIFAANIPGNTCGRCHADERLNEKYGLPVANVATFEDSYHGLALRAGRLTVANCSSCHGVHDIRRSSDPRSLVNPANLAQTCGKCHPGAGTLFKLGAVHVMPTAAGAGAVYWVRFVYLWIIALSIGSMALHNLLDFSRKARRPRVPPPMVSVPERMPRVLRWQHGLMMLSFPVLVYTGFALTYPEAWWAAPLLRWEATFGLRGLLHRVAAIVMVVGLLWHAEQLAVSRRLRACLKGLWWSKRDLSQVAGSLAYYLRRRSTRPQMGKFSYVEKVEYWAFLWGATVMTITGFLLWFVNIALRYLPSWTTDIATAIHFYEAILATLSILVWHLYWVIFDPEVYPMDWSWWDGHPPPSRVHEHMELGADQQPAPATDSNRPGGPGPVKTS
jgi:cytochrome b subunit of formate dehydrogenase